MRLTVSNDNGYNATILTAQVNCNTDAMPPMARVAIFGLTCDKNSAMAALAAACIFHKYCGEQIDFGSIKLGPNHLEAIRHIVGFDVNVSTIDGRFNKLTDASIDMMVLRNGQSPRHTLQDNRSALRRIVWGGDFVDPKTRSSAGYRIPEIYTNACLTCDDLHVSAAIGLLAGAERLRNLYLDADGSAANRKKLQFAFATAGMSALFP